VSGADRGVRPSARAARFFWLVSCQPVRADKDFLVKSFSVSVDDYSLLVLTHRNSLISIENDTFSCPLPGEVKRLLFISPK
jgi:hypothetical protein